MDLVQAYNQTQKLQRLYARWEKQGLTEQQRKTRLNAFLDESKRKHLKEEGL